MKRIIITLFLLFSSSPAVAIPCADTYENYREDLINYQYIPITCKGEYIAWKELCDEGKKDELPYAVWEDKKGNGRFQFLIFRSMKRGLCLVPNYYYKNLKEKKVSKSLISRN